MKCKSSVIAFKQLYSINLWNHSIVLPAKIVHLIDWSAKCRVITLLHVAFVNMRTRPFEQPEQEIRKKMHVWPSPEGNFTVPFTSCRNTEFCTMEVTYYLSQRLLDITKVKSIKVSQKKDFKCLDLYLYFCYLCFKCLCSILISAVSSRTVCSLWMFVVFPRATCSAAVLTFLQ